MQSDPNHDIHLRKTSIFEKILIAVIVFISISAIFWMSRGQHQARSQAKVAVVYEGDQLLQQVHMEKDRIVALPLKGMQIETKGGKIRVAMSDCPKKICVNMGWIKTPGQIIVCAPNKVVIEIESSEPQLLDAVVY